MLCGIQYSAQVTWMSWYLSCEVSRDKKSHSCLFANYLHTVADPSCLKWALPVVMAVWDALGSGPCDLWRSPQHGHAHVATSYCTQTWAPRSVRKSLRNLGGRDWTHVCNSVVVAHVDRDRYIRYVESSLAMVKVCFEEYIYYITCMPGLHGWKGFTYMIQNLKQRIWFANHKFFAAKHTEAVFQFTWKLAAGGSWTMGWSTAQLASNPSATERRLTHDTCSRTPGERMHDYFQRYTEYELL